ncbi:MAG: cytochrome d ubiquinol oxidase subunit II [Deltaproteobacteria bacterium]|nr:cytochrome d ubiquinol oxidase subunit II [Deltaproteobacteria bacterium]
MIGNLDHSQLQYLWWVVVSLIGGLFIAMAFVQGGQTLLLTATRSEAEKTLMINSLGRKWELTFTTLVLFGGAMFAAFPLFYATSFGGAYWVWMAILFTFVIQAVSYEYRTKPGNLFGARTYEIFLFINGSLGLFLLGAAVGTFFTGSSFSLDVYNRATWHGPWRGLEAALNPFNVALGVFLVFLARALGAMYLVNNLEQKSLVERLRRSALVNLAVSLPFLVFVLYRLVTMAGYGPGPGGKGMMLMSGRYFQNLLANPAIPALLILGLALVVFGTATTAFTSHRRGFWWAGSGTVLTVLALFFLAGFNGTPFYPSTYDPRSGLTIASASSSHYTLTAMSYIALAVPLVLGYIAWVWRAMDKKPLSLGELERQDPDELY